MADRHDERDDDAVPYIPFGEFSEGLPRGRFRVVVNPRLARRFVAQRLLLMVILTPVIGVGIALALTGQRWTGALLVAAGVVLHRVIQWQAPRIVLHLAATKSEVYEQVTTEGVLEVRRAGQ